MKSPLLFIIVTLELAGCGVIVPYVYDSQKLHDRLTVAMSKEQVLDQLGKPDRVVQDGEHDTILEYRLYPKGEWAAYLIHCPIFPNCYFPAEAGHPYYVVLHDKQLCMWGTPHVVMPLIKLACGNASQLDRKEHMRGGLRISMVPLFMPPPIRSHTAKTRCCSC